MVNNKFPPCVQNSRFFAIGWAERGGYILLSLCLLIQVYCLARWIETVWLQTHDFLNPWAYAWIGFAVVRYTCKPLVEYLSQRRALFLVQSVQSHLLHQYFYESPYQSRSMDAAAWTTLVQDQIPLLHNYFAQYQPAAWLLRVMPILYVAVIIGHDWFLGLLFVCTIPLLPFFMMIIGWGAQSVQKKHAQMLQKLSSLFADRLRVLSMLQRFGAVSQQAQVLVDRHTEWKQLTLKVLKIAFLSSAVLELFAALSVALVAMTIGFRWLGTFPLPLPELKFYIGFFILFLAPEVYAPFRQYAVLYHEKDQALAVLATIPSSAYAAPIQVEYPPKNVPSHSGYESPAAPENNYLHFQALRPQYTHINVDAVFKARDKVYITGKNGVGKTALLEACLGILPYTGDILLQGTSMKACPQNASASFFYLPATPRILPLSLAENIALAYPAASPAEILQAARQACIDPKFLTESSLSARCDEQLIPQLSAGQLQRFALARLWLSRAPILLLDEPFSYQDASTKVLLMERLLAFAHDRLLILVSHEPIVHSAFTHILDLSEPEHTL